MPVEAVARLAGDMDAERHDGAAGRGREAALEPATAAGAGRPPVRRRRRRAPEATPRDLSPRQLEVMHLLSEGCSVKEIARRMDIGIGTVKVNLSRAYSALGAHNRIEAVARAQGLLEAQAAAKG